MPSCLESCPMRSARHLHRALRRRASSGRRRWKRCSTSCLRRRPWVRRLGCRTARRAMIEEARATLASRRAAAAWPLPASGCDPRRCRRATRRAMLRSTPASRSSSSRTTTYLRSFLPRSARRRGGHVRQLKRPPSRAAVHPRCPMMITRGCLQSWRQRRGRRIGHHALQRAQSLRHHRARRAISICPPSRARRHRPLRRARRHLLRQLAPR
jgi:hypothetical protein